MFDFQKVLFIFYVMLHYFPSLLRIKKVTSVKLGKIVNVEIILVVTSVHVATGSSIMMRKSVAE